ncbi:hypothetical protein [Haloarchaeobius sp. DFWS5]|uniref:hypothetical protein n=1 Tax=Haloarchaeobius sp. DFWS5 TaxID=3446114 RepID=UPI003EBEA603
MKPSSSRRTLLVQCATALAVGTAGCLSGEEGGPSSGETASTSESTAAGDTTSQAESTTTVQTTVDPERADDAKERALSAEAAYIQSAFQNASCVTDWGLDAVTGEKEATVVEETGEGLSVEVHHPYWYETEKDQADSISVATYRVTEGSVERVDGDTNQNPCP